MKDVDRLDLDILKNGSLVMYHNLILLKEDIEWFDKANYNIIDINTSSWNNKNFHSKIEVGFDFPDYYGKNLNALSDCIDDMKNKKYKGLILAFRNFDKFAESDKQLASALLDIVAIISRRWLIKGYYLIGIIHSNNPDIQFEPLGAIKPFWNGNEFIDYERRNKIIPT